MGIKDDKSVTKVRSHAKADNAQRTIHWCLLVRSIVWYGRVVHQRKNDKTTRSPDWKEQDKRCQKSNSYRSPKSTEAKRFHKGTCVLVPSACLVSVHSSAQSRANSTWNRSMFRFYVRVRVGTQHVFCFVSLLDLSHTFSQPALCS